SQTADLVWKNGGYYTFSGYQKTIEGAGEIEDDPVIDPEPGEPVTYTAYFDNSVSNWSQVKAWAWDVNNGNKNYTGGTWPGQDINFDNQSGYHKFSCTVSDANPKMMIIFNNGSLKTADLDFVNNGIYTVSGFTGKTYGSTGIANVNLDGINVSAYNGRLQILSDRAVTLTVTRVDGMTLNVTVQEGVNTIELPKGLYIVAGKKVIL
ncbi:MAG: starch-binding protein, partial [Muribaculaceae bacterium]|nr:starch-binding protein [Muribaculaceae bacterium]